MRILVTGASGFVGRALCSFLANGGYQVRCAIRGDHRHRRRIESGAPFEFVNVGDINRDTNWQQALLDVDVIVHLAACVHKLNGVKEPFGEKLLEKERFENIFDEVNTKGTQNLVLQAKKAVVKRIVFMSSVKVFGELTDDEDVLTENSLTGTGCDAYGLSKLSAERQLQTELRNSTMDFVIIRSPLVYGPQVKANFALLLGLLKTGIPLPFAGIHNKRSMVAIDNLVSFIGCCITSERARNQIYLISDDDDVSLSQLVLLIRGAMRVSKRLFFLPTMALNLVAVLIGRKQPLEKLTSSFRVSCQKAKQQLGWQPAISVENAIIQTADAYMKNR